MSDRPKPVIDYIATACHACTAFAQYRFKPGHAYCSPHAIETLLDLGLARTRLDAIELLRDVKAAAKEPT